MTTAIKIPSFTDMMKTRQLTESEASDFLRINLGKDVEIPLEEDDTLSVTLLGQILLSRIKSYELGFNVTNAFFGMSVMTFAERPGRIMILLRLMYENFQKYRIKDFDINHWGMTMFAMGVPTDDSLEEMWESQKCKREDSFATDNLLDYKENWS